MIGQTLFFAAAVAVWILFVYALFAGRLDDVWTWVRHLPLILQLVAWALLLPYMIALWIWEGAWALWLRVVLVAGLAFATVLLTFPRAK